MRVVLIALMLCAGCGVVPTAATRTSALVGANEDDGGYPEVIALRLHLASPDGGVDFKHCSGTLITPTVVLTAAHCTSSALLPGTTLVAMQAQPLSPVDAGVWLATASWRPHPSWTTSTANSYDIGVVKLAAPLDGIAPRPFSRHVLAAADVGRPLDVVGYGVTASGSLDFGIRRHVQLPLRGLTSTLIELGDRTTSGICNGDSGGPSILREADGVGRVVGVHSRTVPGANCMDGVDTRVHLYGAFIAQFLSDTSGPSCVEDGLCATGCPTVDVDCVCGADAQCNPQCPNLLSDPDCPVDCVANGVCATQSCPRPDPDCTDELASCTDDAQCQLRTCAADALRGERYCTRPCAAGCLAGTACVGAACLKALPSAAAGEPCTIGGTLCPPRLACTGLEGEPTRCLATCQSATDCQADEECVAAQAAVSVCRALVSAGPPSPVSGGCVSAPAASVWVGLLACVLCRRRRTPHGAASRR